MPGTRERSGQKADKRRTRGGQMSAMSGIVFINSQFYLQISPLAYYEEESLRLITDSWFI